MAAWLLHRLGKMPRSRFDEHRRGIYRKLRYLNVGRQWPFKDASAEAIFSSHVVEHLTLHSARTCLMNAFRVLKKGGVLRIVVPDLDKLISNYDAHSAFDWAHTFFEADNTAEKNMHHFMYNCASLTRMMHEAGFDDVRRVDYRQGVCPDIETLDNRPDSLFMEAIK